MTNDVDATLPDHPLDDTTLAIELAWGLIANAWAFVEREGGPTSDEWIKAAERWRDAHALDSGE